MRVLGRTSSIILGLLLLSIPVCAADHVSLVEALSAVENSVDLIQARNSLLGAEAALATLAEEQRFSWQLQSPSFIAGSDDFGEVGAWAITGTRGGVDKVTARAYPDELSVTWSRGIWPDPAIGQELQEENLRYRQRSSELELASRYYQSLIDIYERYLSAQLDSAGLAVNRKRAELDRKEYEKALALAEIGEISPAAVTRAKAGWVKTDAQLKKDEAAAAKNTNLLLVSLGFEAGAKLEAIKVEASLQQALVVVGQQPPSGYSVERILAKSTEISVLKEQVRLQELALAKVQADSPWSVGVEVGAGVNLTAQEPRWQIGVGALTYDFSGGAAHQRQLTQAQQDLELARRLLAEAKNRLSQDYQAAVINLAYQHSLLQAAVWEWEAMQSDYKVTLMQQEAGLVSSEDLARAKLGIRESELSVARALLAYEIQKYRVQAMQGERPLLALVKGESINER